MSPILLGLRLICPLPPSPLQSDRNKMLIKRKDRQTNVRVVQKMKDKRDKHNLGHF
jgi:hypothetical protein